jgi:hypothetical protein
MPEDGDGFSGLLFVGQIIAVPFLAIPLGSLLIEIVGLAPGRLEENWLAPLICYAGVGFAEGYFTERVSGCADRFRRPFRLGFASVPDCDRGSARS